MDYRVIVKILLTALIVTAISEVAKRSTTAGAILAALPLTSLLAMIWLYADTKQTEPVAELSMGIFWAVIPSLVLFPVFAWLLRTDLSFTVALLIACAVTVVVYYLYYVVLEQFGITF